MKHYYCFEISFPGIDFDSYMQNSQKAKQTHHAHLYCKENEIEIRVYFDSPTLFGYKLGSWASDIGLQKFGSFISSSKESQNQRLLKIDFSDSSLCGIAIGTNQYEGAQEYVIIKIDSVTLFFEPMRDKLNTAEFYLNKSGFNLVSDYYGLLSGQDGEFKIPRRKDSDVFYSLGKADFRPEYKFERSDSTSNPNATITKVPILQFRFQKGATKEDMDLYGELVCSLASFYFHTKIDFALSCLYLSDSTVEIRKLPTNIYKEHQGNLWGFKIRWDFHQFIQACCNRPILEQSAKISKVIELFNQSHLVGGSSQFLIRYNIIEICMGGKKDVNEIFTPALKEVEIKSIYDECLALLLSTVILDEREAFEKKWKGIPAKLKFKPMRGPLEAFLEEQRLPIKVKEINKLKDLRDSLTHGSLKSISYSHLEKANNLMYRIAGILILNLLGIKEWEFDTNLN